MDHTPLSERAAQIVFSELSTQKEKLGMWGWMLEELQEVMGEEYGQNTF